MSAPTVDREILEAYRQWLHHEGRLLGDELYPELGDHSDRFIPETFAKDFHFPTDGDWRDVPKPSTRAAAVLEAVGVIPEGKPATEEEWAAMDFEPWPEGDLNGWNPMAGSEASWLGPQALTTVRIAWRVMHMTKSEVMQVVDVLDNTTGGHLRESFEGLQSYIKGLEALLQGAEMRILCAGAAVAIAEDGKPDH